MKKNIKVDNKQSEEQSICQGQIDDLTNRWKRALADYQNLQRRYESEKTDFIQFANSSLVLKLLGIFGHLEIAAENVKDRGLSLVVAEFKRILSEEGVTEILCQGEKFDPQLMEAVDVVNGPEDGRIAEVINKGYLLKGKLLLPAKVKVFEAPTTKAVGESQ